MALSYLLDEHLRGSPLWRAILQHNAGGLHPLDVVRVGDPADLPLGSPDPTILLWAESHGRILLTLDHNTMPGHVAAHLQAGHHSPGIFIIRRRRALPQIVFHLALAAYAGDPMQFQDQITYIP